MQTVIVLATGAELTFERMQNANPVSAGLAALAMLALALAITARVRGSQSGRLSSYLLYMLIAVILALALVPILR